MADIRINALATTAASTASDDFIAVDGSANGTRKLDAYSPTFGGNLTVSGGTITGGTSGMSLAAGGTNQNITLTPSGTGSVAASSTGANVLTLFRDITNTGVGTAIKLRQKDAASATVDIADIYAYKSVGTAGSVSSWLGIATRNAGTLTDAMYIAPSGNVVLGSTATDSSNGRLQLATHTTSAGGIGFGTDNQLFRYNAVQLALTNSSGTSGSAIASNMQLRVENSGNGGIQINVPDASTGGVYFGRAADAYYSGVERSGTNLQLRNNGTTALTLDSSQNATFAGQTVNVSKAGNNPSLKATDGAVITKLQSQTAGDTTGAIGTESNHTLKLITNNTTRLTIAATGDATFTGAIAIGNTVNTVSPTSPNRTITMVIGGTTYYIHAKTTND